MERICYTVIVCHWGNETRLRNTGGLEAEADPIPAVGEILRPADRHDQQQEVQKAVPPLPETLRQEATLEEAMEEAADELREAAGLLQGHPDIIIMKEDLPVPVGEVIAEDLISES